MNLYLLDIPKEEATLLQAHKIDTGNDKFWLWFCIPLIILQGLAILFLLCGRKKKISNLSPLDEVVPNKKKPDIAVLDMMETLPDGFRPQTISPQNQEMDFQPMPSRLHTIVDSVDETIKQMVE